jgi:HlyD family secretion protein
MRARTIWIASGCLALTLAVLSVWLSQKNDATLVETEKVRRRNIERRLRATGHLDAAKKVSLTATVSGNLVEVNVREGQKVRQGDLLARIDPGSTEGDIKEKLASIRELEAQVRAAQVRYRGAAAEYSVSQRLFAQKQISKVERERASRDLAVANAELEGARQRLAKTQADMAQLETRLTRTQIVAPVDGTVLTLEKKQGERVRFSEVSEDLILTLAPLEVLDVELEVREHEIVHVEPGASAEVVIEAVGQTIPGKVTEVASAGIIRNKGQPNEVTRFPIRVTLDHAAPHVRAGMTANVSILTGSAQNVLSVPFEAVTTRPRTGLSVPDASAAPNKPLEVVFAVEQGAAALRPVVAGIAGDTHVEIREGLKEGEEIIVGPYSAVSKDLGPGTPVRTEARPDSSAELPSPSTPAGMAGG